MTGIGFLGAGVVVKEGLTIRGLTTAASIWMTAAVGILAGIGQYLPLGLVTLITLGTLSVFRLIEAKKPAQSYSRLEAITERSPGCWNTAWSFAPSIPPTSAACRGICATCRYQSSCCRGWAISRWLSG
jgi:hypothetical protein